MQERGWVRNFGDCHNRIEIAICQSEDVADKYPPLAKASKTLDRRGRTGSDAPHRDGSGRSEGSMMAALIAHPSIGNIAFKEPQEALASSSTRSRPHPRKLPCLPQ